MKHFFTSRVRVVMVVAVLLAVLLAVAGNLLGKDIPGMVVKGVLTPLRTGMSKLVDQAERYYSYIFRYEALEAENEMLKEQLAQLEDNSRKLDSVQRENDTLRDLLELKKDHEDYAMVDAYIIARPSDDFTSTLTINRGQNAGIEVGMCAVTEHGAVVGLAVDYGIHIYAARRGRSGLRRVGRIALPVAAGATTSCGVFLLLTGTGIAAYRQLGIYAAMALALSLLLFLMLLPGLLGSRGGRCRELRGVTWSHRQRRVVLLIWGGLLLLALPAAMKIHFSTGMEQFDGAPAEVRRDEAEFNAAWRRAPAPAVVIELADSLPELETRLEQRYRQLLPLAGESEIFGPSALWPAPEVRARNLAAWRAWLDSGHGGALFRELRRAAVARGFDPTFFAPFEQTLKAGIAAGEQQVLPEPIDSCLKRTRRRTPEGGWAGVLLVRDTPETVRQVRAALAAEPGAAVLSPVAFEQMLGTEFGQRFRYLLPSALVLIAVCAIFFLGSWRRALAALSVPATALLLVLGGYAWWGVELNMVSAFAGLVLAGLAIDYGIFAVHACAEGRHSGLWTALLLSAATTFVTGAAVLFSRHPVLFYTGLTLSLGILIAWLTAVLAVPALPRRWLAGCAGVLLLTVVGGCRTPAFTRGALPELEPEQALREYRQWRERGMEAATWEAGLVFEYGFWQFPLLTVGQVEPAAEALRLVGLSPAGGTVFELAGRSQTGGRDGE